MEEKEINLGEVESGFEELPADEPAQNQGKRGSGNRPDYRVVQVETNMEGKTIYKSVGGMWKNVSKNGNEFYTLLIGNLKLLVFKNDRKFDNKQ